MPRLLQVAGWSTHFENNKSRERDRCAWVAIPNKQDGLGLMRILALPDGTAVLGLWILVVQACSRHARPRDGWLTEDGRRDAAPWTVADMALRWRRPEAEVERAVHVLATAGWLVDYGEAVAHPAPAGQEVPAECPPAARPVPWKGREGKGRGGEGSDPPAPPPPSRSVDDEADGVAPLRAIAGIELPRRDRPAWRSLLADVGLDLIRQGVDAALAAGKPGHLEHVAPVARRLAAAAKAEAEQVGAPERAERQFEADLRHEAEQRAAAAAKAASDEARMRGPNVEAARALLAEVDAVGWRNPPACLARLRAAVAAGKVAELTIGLVRTEWRRLRPGVLA